MFRYYLVLAFDGTNTSKMSTTTAATTTAASTTTTTPSAKTTPAPTLSAKTKFLKKSPKLPFIKTKSTFQNTWLSTTDGIHEFAWGKSKEDDESFTFSPTPTPTASNIYIEYIKKELAQRMKNITNLAQTTLDPRMNKTQFVFEKFNTRKTIKQQTITPKNPNSSNANGVHYQNQHKYENPQHYIEKITEQKNKAKQPHTVIKKTHITIDEVEQHSGGNNKSDSIEKHIELDESETDIEGQNEYDTVTAFSDEGQTEKGSTFKILESQWGVSPSQKADPWLPIAVSHAAVNIAKDMDKTFQPHGKLKYCFQKWPWEAWGNDLTLGSISMTRFFQEE